MTMLNYSQPSRLNIPVNQSLPTYGKNTFQAKVTESISEGYTIETVIDGKPLHGILFLNKPNTLHLASHTSSRKRTASEAISIVSNGMHPNNLKTFKVLKQEVQGNGSEYHEHRTEAITALISSNPTTAGASKTLEVK